MVSLLPITPAKGYIDSQRAYEMALAHHYPTDGRVRNYRGDMAYLRWLLRHFKGDVTKAVAAYNAGEGAVRKYGGIPPYRETQNYVRKIRRLYTKLRHPI